ncbi:MAG: hypothetical protein COY66_06370 [Candidatus Kerfeldbacteria bacterium CG_4_10_14_0_8_um_filter_42_10]|uniref:CYTH domain-containing protein n=1 Tax=Candidatus Kerfeldbacteria bacterium CG_4_10_14_0_8_um_filter_42_10 TaxID=2014248 RepID=A0A2M7RG71_9BACT|nr:MAG: hypothetical protein COY66_06370 [Candidatus Kerfeldbacteria bacterium CG_4_10_14_0_8_um_filter_42_10]
MGLPKKQKSPEQKQPREIEAKIINLGDPKSFLKRLQEQGGVLITERRLLRDIGFKFEKELEHIVDLSFDSTGIGDIDRFKEMLQMLGIKIVFEDSNAQRMNLKAGPDILIRSVRIREENDQLVFSVKEKRDKTKQIDNRIELQVRILKSNPILQLLKKIGYQQYLNIEKYRTSFQLDDCLVELNEGPLSPAWAEIEAKNEEQVYEIAQKLGYQAKDVKGMSDQDYYKLYHPNLTPQALHYLTFDQKND